MHRRSATGGQIAVDFLSGITVFVISLIFVFGFITSAVIPYTDTSGNTPGTAERAAEKLYSETLTTHEEAPGVLNATVADAYFDEFGDDVDAVKRHLGLAEERGVSVTVVNAPSGDVVDVSGNEWNAGGSAPVEGSASVSSTTRVAFVGEPVNETVHVVVRVW